MVGSPRTAIFACLWLHAKAGGSWIDKYIPFHEKTDYPDIMQQWEKLMPAFQTIQTNNNINEASFASVDGLPFLPCVSFPNVTMDDGTRLFTVVIRPYPCEKKRAAILVRSPYGPTTQNIALIFTVLNGFAAVMQDQRGTVFSEGSSKKGNGFDLFRSDGEDGRTTMKWITSQSWSNGDVYTAGISADGISTMCPSLKPGTPVKGQWAMWTTSNGHEFVYPQGLYRQDLLHGYLGLVSLLSERRTTIDEIEHQVWKAESFGPWWYNLTDVVNVSDPSFAPGNSFVNVQWPIIFTVGWWDIFEGVNLRAVEAIWDDHLGDPSVREKHVIIIGPLGHCLIGNTFGFSTEVQAHYYEAEANGIAVSAELASEMWKGHDHGFIRSRIGRLNFFLMGNFGGEAPHGTPGNYWVSLEDWPNFTSRNMYLQPGRVLSNSSPSTDASVHYTYDPTAKDGLTPMIGGNNLPINTHVSHCGSSDLTNRDNRDDVLVFDSGLLQDDLPLMGKVRATLFVSSSAKDTDFIVTIADLGKSKSMLVRYGAVRMRWRNGGTGNYITPKAPLVNGTVYKIDIDLLHTAYVFPKGHRLRVTISSAAYPYYDANPNTGSPEVTGIPPSRFEPVPATNVIHMGPHFPSRISLPAVKIDDLPHNPKFRPTIPRPTESTFIV